MGILTIVGIAVLSSINTLTIDNLSAHRVDLYITNVQFDDDYLNITVRNIGWNPTTISSVIINQTITLQTIPVHEPILAGEIISFHIAFKWTSGYTYQIKLETTDNFENHGCNTISAKTMLAIQSLQLPHREQHAHIMRNRRKSCVLVGICLTR